MFRYGRQNDPTDPRGLPFPEYSGRPEQSKDSARGLDLLSQVERAASESAGEQDFLQEPELSLGQLFG